MSEEFTYEFDFSLRCVVAMMLCMRTTSQERLTMMDLVFSWVVSDESACNYDDIANEDDGTCNYCCDSVTSSNEDYSFRGRVVR